MKGWEKRRERRHARQDRLFDPSMATGSASARAAGVFAEAMSDGEEARARTVALETGTGASTNERGTRPDAAPTALIDLVKTYVE